MKPTMKHEKPATPTKTGDLSSASKVQIGGDHYKKHSIQPWDAMEQWMSKEEFNGFLKGNAIKYLARSNDKGGLEDVKKANHYLQKYLEVNQ